MDQDRVSISGGPLSVSNSSCLKVSAYTYLLVNTYLQESLKECTISLDNLMDSATRMRSNGGKARAKLSKEILSAIGRKGGQARAAAMSDSARSKAARRAVKIRWARVKAARTAAALKQTKRKRKAGGRPARLS